MDQKEIDAMPFYKKLAKLKQGIVIPPPIKERRVLDMVTVAESALNHTSRGAFMKADPSAYRWARVNGYLDEMCSHMVAQKRGPKPKGVQLCVE